MLIIKWIPITETEEIPPLGKELELHLNNLRGAVKYASCAAWNLLYSTLLENNFPTSPVSFTDTGKPYFLKSDIHFSVSHSYGACAIATADRPVGVDVEVVKTFYNPHMIEKSLTAAEMDSFDGDFTRIWCRKEAVAKMTGQGITGYPKTIDTTEYKFTECQIECGGQKYWLVAVVNEVNNSGEAFN